MGSVDLIFCFRDCTTRCPDYKPTIDSRAVELLGPGNHSMAERSVPGEFALVTKSEHVSAVGLASVGTAQSGFDGALHALLVKREFALSSLPARRLALRIDRFRAPTPDQDGYSVDAARAGSTLCILLVFFGVVSLLPILTLVSLHLQDEAQCSVAVILECPKGDEQRVLASVLPEEAVARRS